MGRLPLTQQPQSQDLSYEAGGHERPSPFAHGLLALQGFAGNRAVANLFSGGPTVVQRDEKDEPPADFAIYVGDGKHKPDDAKHAAMVGQKDAARLRKAGTLSLEDRQEINAKLRYFQGAGHAAYAAQVKPALVEVTREEIDMSEEATADQAEPLTPAQLATIGKAVEINGIFDDIRELRSRRIDTWKSAASVEEPKPLRAALGIAVAVAAAATGGVFGAVIAKSLTNLTQEFVKSGGGELIEKLSESSFESAMRDAGATLQKGALGALAALSGSGIVDAALTGKNTDLIGVYSEAMQLQAVTETSKQREEFNSNAESTYLSAALLQKRIALKVIYQRLLVEPQAFQRELTVGFLRLMDENHVAKTAKEDYGGDRERAWREDSDLHEVDRRLGNLMLVRTPYGTLGDWGRPNLNFGFNAVATEVNTVTLMDLAGTPIKDLPLTLAFRHWAENPIYRLIYGGDWVKVWFTRDPDGNVYLDDDLGEGAMEWLASYYSGIDRILTDDEREKYAPLGAKKLYEATKTFPVKNLSNSDLL